jgi:ankyrin repeat protein
VSSLLTKKADTSVKDKEDYTALYHASNMGYIDIAKLLINYESIITTKAKDLHICLQAAVEKRYLEIVNLSIKA